MATLQLTELQCKVLAFIVERAERSGMPPTLREIALQFGWKAVGSAQDIVQALRKKGLLHPPVPGKSRQLVPTQEAYLRLQFRADASSNGQPESSISGHTLPTSPTRFAYGTAPEHHHREMSASEKGPVTDPGRSQQLLRQQRAALALQMATASMGTGKKAHLPTPPHTAEAGALLGRRFGGPTPLPNMAGILRVPVLGLVQAGNPTEAIENAGEHVMFHSLPGRGIGVENCFAVVVEGYSMMNVGFLPGDFLLIEAASNAKNGDIVLAALQDHEVTVKRFAMRGSLLYRQALEKIQNGHMQTEQPFDRLPPALLVPENPDFDPLVFGAHDSDKIIGLVRSLFRREVV